MFVITRLGGVFLPIFFSIASHALPKSIFLFHSLTHSHFNHRLYQIKTADPDLGAFISVNIDLALSENVKNENDREEYTRSAYDILSCAKDREGKVMVILCICYWNLIYVDFSSIKDSSFVFLHLFTIKSTNKNKVMIGQYGMDLLPTLCRYALDKNKIIGDFMYNLIQVCWQFQFRAVLSLSLALFYSLYWCVI